MAAIFVLVYVSTVSSRMMFTKLHPFFRSDVHLFAVLSRLSAQCSVFFGPEKSEAPMFQYGFRPSDLVGLTVLSVLCICGPGKHHFLCPG
jgi:hypothetical protein